MFTGLQNYFNRFSQHSIAFPNEPAQETLESLDKKVNSAQSSLLTTLEGVEKSTEDAAKRSNVLSQRFSGSQKEVSAFATILQNAK